MCVKICTRCVSCPFALCPRPPRPPTPLRLAPNFHWRGQLLTKPSRHLSQSCCCSRQPQLVSISSSSSCCSAHSFSSFTFPCASFPFASSPFFGNSLMSRCLPYVYLVAWGGAGARILFAFDYWQRHNWFSLFKLHCDDWIANWIPSFFLVGGLSEKQFAVFKCLKLGEQSYCIFLVWWLLLERKICKMLISFLFEIAFRC